LARLGKILYAIGVSLFALALIAGFVQSLRVDKRAPAVDLFGNGSKAYISRLLARHDYRRAMQQLELQSRLLPYDAPTYEELGILLGNQSRPKEARVQFEALVRLRPDDAEGYFFLGSTYLDTNQPALATPILEKAILLKPDLALAHNKLGIALAAQGNLVEAEAHFARAVDLAPTNAEARANLNRARAELPTK
jgi:Flp pilus assembly protein TadD